MVGRLREQGVGAMLLRPSPRTDPAGAERFPPYLEVIDRVAAAYGLPVADAFGEFVRGARAGRKMLGPDGIHHDRDGFEGMARAVLDALGYPETAIDMEIRPYPNSLLAWDMSEPVPWNTGDPIPELHDARNWRPYDRQAAVKALPWWDAAFAMRGAWMPFACAKPEQPSVRFGRTIFEVKDDGEKELQIGGSPPLMVWLNGREVWRALKAHGYHPNADRLPVRVVKGKNEIIVISNYMVFMVVK
jgi:hypothetical protein